MYYGPRFDQVLTQSGRDVAEVFYSFGISFALMLPMFMGWELARYLRPSTPPRVPSISFVMASLFTISLCLLLQFSHIGGISSTVFGGILSICVAGAEIARGARATYGLEARLCTSITVLVTIYVAMRKESEAFAIVALFYLIAGAWSISLTVSSVIMRRLHPKKIEREEKEEPDNWFGAFTAARSVPRKRKRRQKPHHAGHKHESRRRKYEFELGV